MAPQSCFSICYGRQFPHTHQFPFFDLSALHFRLLRNDTEVRIPRSAYRQRLFLCGPASFFELHCIPRISGALSSNSRRARYLRRQRRSAFSPGRECITNILCLRSSCSACCLASPQLDLVSPAFGADALVFDFLFLYLTKSDSFSLAISLGELVFPRRLFQRRESHYGCESF